MDIVFKYDLTNDERKSISDFYNSLPFVTMEQNLLWVELSDKGKHCFFWAIENREIVCAAIIKESKKAIFNYAEIEFGPLFKDSDMLIESVKAIHDYYKKKSFTFLSAQLAHPTGTLTDYVEYRLNKILQVKQQFDRDNWSSVIIDLSKDENEIFKSFSKGHKSDIKKSLKNELTASAPKDNNEMNAFIDIFIRMQKERSLPVVENETRSFFNRVYDFLLKNRLGKILLVKDKEQKILGGVVLLCQGCTIRYFKGAADPALRQIPILHLALWEGIREAKKDGFKKFDLWGYNHFVDENDQVFYINRFKKGFGGDFIFYPKKMYFIFNGLLFFFYTKGLKIYKKYKTRKGKMPS